MHLRHSSLTVGLVLQNGARLSGWWVFLEYAQTDDQPTVASKHYQTIIAVIWMYHYNMKIIVVKSVNDAWWVPLQHTPENATTIWATEKNHFFFWDSTCLWHKYVRLNHKNQLGISKISPTVRPCVNSPKRKDGAITQLIWKHRHFICSTNDSSTGIFLKFIGCHLLFNTRFIWKQILFINKSPIRNFKI